MLECRLRELWDVVDVFVLAEGTTTFGGEPKPLFFAEAKDRFAPYLGKIIPVVARLDDVDRWHREWVLRDALARPLPGLKLADDDIFVLSDVDEIPDARTLARLRDTGVASPVALAQDFYYYNLSCKAVYQWTMARVCPASTKSTMQAIRSGGSQVIVPSGGWHLSNFMPPDKIRNKYDNGGHANPGAIGDVASHIASRTDLFGRDAVRFEHVPIETNPYLPREIDLFRKFFG